MGDKTSAASQVAVVVAPSGTSIQILGDRLTAALKDAGVMQFGPVRMLGDEGFAAVEQPFEHLHPADMRRALEIEFEGEADICVLPVKDRRKKLLISDMDSTIIDQECLDELAGFAGLKEEISAITARAMAGELDFESALRERVAKLNGLSTDALKQCYEELITLAPGARTLVSTMAANGARCVLVSGGFTFFTERVAKACGFHAHRGNTLIDDGTTLTGSVASPILGREAKLTALKEEAESLGITLMQSVAMGDGANDLDMIEASGLGLAVHAKPVVAAASNAAINVTDLTAALYFQGYGDSEIVWQR